MLSIVFHHVLSYSATKVISLQERSILLVPLNLTKFCIITLKFLIESHLFILITTFQQSYFHFTEKTKQWIIVNTLSFWWTSRAQNIHSSVLYSSTIPLDSFSTWQITTCSMTNPKIYPLCSIYKKQNFKSLKLCLTISTSVLCLI